jgi:hypothetical protein
VRQHPLPDGEVDGGEVSWWSSEMIKNPIRKAGCVIGINVIPGLLTLTPESPCGPQPIEKTIAAKPHVTRAM